MDNKKEFLILSNFLNLEQKDIDKTVLLDAIEYITDMPINNQIDKEVYLECLFKYYIAIKGKKEYFNDELWVFDAFFSRIHAMFYVMDVNIYTKHYFNFIHKLFYEFGPINLFSHIEVFINNFSSEHGNSENTIIKILTKYNMRYDSFICKLIDYKFRRLQEFDKLSTKYRL